MPDAREHMTGQTLQSVGIDGHCDDRGYPRSSCSLRTSATDSSRNMPIEADAVRHMPTRG
jgi:hypothetical protein